MATVIIKAKDRKEWLQHREAGIGSSEVATIIGVNPYQTPYQLWRRKKQMDPPQEENMLMRLGHLLEDAVANLWSEETGREVIKSSAGDWLISNDKKPFLRVSPDRTFWLPGMAKNNHNKGILECKTTQKEIDQDDLPKTWFCQTQYQLGVAEIEQGSIAWLSMGRNFGYKDINFVPEFYGWMIEEVEKFWTDHIIGNQEPAPMTAQDIMTKYTRHADNKYIEVGEEILEAYTKLKEIKAQLKELEERQAALEDQIKMTIHDAEGISYGGQTLATWKAARDNAKLDTKALAEAHPTIAAQFTRATPGSRRFLIK